MKASHRWWLGIWRCECRMLWNSARPTPGRSALIQKHCPKPFLLPDICPQILPCEACGGLGFNIALAQKQNSAVAKHGATATWLDYARLASSACHRPTPLCQLVNQVRALSEMPSSLPWRWRALEEHSQLDQGAVGLVGEDMTRMGIE